MVSEARKQSYKKGHWAENFAALYFMSKGYKVLRRRFKTKGGEIDLVLQKKDKIIFVEVKARRNIDDALHSIHAKNRSRIENAARQFLSENPEYRDFEISLDAFCVAVKKGFVPLRFVHLDNAWFSGS